jgi:glutamate-1-semialdehyde 2,1-aminomutase
MRQIFRARGVPAIVQCVGPMFQIMFTQETKIRDCREFCTQVDRVAYRRLSHKLFEFGVYSSPAAGLHSIATVAHGREDVEYTLTALGRALDALR